MPTRSLRSSSSLSLCVPNPKTGMAKSKSFPSVASSIWNKLTVSSISTSPTFRKRLKHHLFLSAIPGNPSPPTGSGVASPKKVGGPNHVSLLVSSKSYNIHTWGTPPYMWKKLFNGFALIPRGVWTEVGGSGPLHSPPWRRHCPLASRFLMSAHPQMQLRSDTPPPPG